MARLFYLVAGVFTGIILGGMLALGICTSLEAHAGFFFGKGPFLETLAGILFGGILGGIVGLKQLPQNPSPYN